MKYLICSVLLSLICNPLLAQNSSSIISFCSFDAVYKTPQSIGCPNVVDNSTPFNNVKEAQEVLDSLCETVFCAHYHLIECNHLGNASACIDSTNLTKYIAYDNIFFQKLKDNDHQIEAKSILAHEIGHQINDHVLMLLNANRNHVIYPDATRRDFEIVADKFSGYAMGRMGYDSAATLKAYYEVITNINDVGTYPAKYKRIEAVKEGWIKGHKEIPSPVRPFKKEPSITTTHSIGEIYQGGIVFFVDKTGLHGLVAAPTDQGTGAYDWGKAVQICQSLELKGYKGWYLPSKDEVNLMYENLYLRGLGNFRADDYWSSSEFGGLNYAVWVEVFSDGTQDHGDKTHDRYFVLAIRRF